MKYFAYGSNMSLRRLQSRVPSARRLGAYRLYNHDLRFHKVSNDGSGKCDAYQTNNQDDVIIGCLYEIDAAEKADLDKVEGLGLGYDEKVITVSNDAEESVDAYTYFATHIDPAMVPYSWYLNHVIVGAKEIGIPNQYLKKLKATIAVEDQDNERALLERSIYK